MDGRHNSLVSIKGIFYLLQPRMRVSSPTLILTAVLGLALLLMIPFILITKPFGEEDSKEMRENFVFECPSFFLSNVTDPIGNIENIEYGLHSTQRNQILQLSNFTEIIVYTMFSDFDKWLEMYGHSWQNPKHVVQYVLRQRSSTLSVAKLTDASVAKLNQSLGDESCLYDLRNSCLDNYHFEVFANSNTSEHRFILREHWNATSPRFNYTEFTSNPEINSIYSNELSQGCESYMSALTG